MNNIRLFSKSYYDDMIRFSVWSLTGSIIYVDGKSFEYDFDSDNEKEMQLIADVLYKYYLAVESYFKNYEDIEKLEAFDLLIQTLNKHIK